MKTVRATVEKGEIRWEESLPYCPEPRAALLVLDVDDNKERMEMLREKLASTLPADEEQFEALGLRDFWGDPVDDTIDWEQFFKTS